MTYDINKITYECERLSNAEYYDILDSTNTKAKIRALEGAKDALLILTNKQTNGRGRLGRTWDSKEEDTITMSLLLRPPVSTDKVSMITIIAALSVYNAMNFKCEIKWPNDIKVGSKKLCGILSESVFSGKDFYSVLGIGINVNNKSFRDDLLYEPSSMYIETGKIYDRNYIVIKILNNFFEYYDILCKDGDLRNIKNEYNSKCVSGIINDFGELLMPNGKYKRSGEV